MRSLTRWLDYFLGGLRWWRRRRGGHWERWFVDPALDSYWERRPVCSKFDGWRPSWACARLECDDYYESLLEKIAKQV